VSRLVLLNPTTLVGKELIEALGDHPLGADLALLSVDEAEIGQLTEAAGAPALVAAADEAAISGAEVLVVCGPAAPYRELLAQRDAAASVVLAGPDATAADGVPVVAGVNPQAAVAGGVMVSPHPGGVLLATLLHPLRSAADLTGGVRRAVATVVMPVSLYDRAGLDELFSQAARMVSMQAQSPSALFGDRQLAFNLYPTPRPPRGLPAELRAVLGAGGSQADDIEVAVHVLQGAVFHGVSALAHVTLGRAVDAGELRRHLGGHPSIELYRPAEGALEQLGPIDVPSSDKVLLGSVEHDPDEAAGGGGTGYWLWAVMDNLTRGGALNVLAILERLLPSA